MSIRVEASRGRLEQSEIGVLGEMKMSEDLFKRKEKPYDIKARMAKVLRCLLEGIDSSENQISVHSCEGK